MARTHTITVKLSDDEYEWIRRKAHWDNVAMSALFRVQLQHVIAEEGYLRPPDDEPQDFGYEKEMMQFVVRVQNERD